MYKPLVAERVEGRITITTQEATHGAKQRLTYPLPARLVRLIFRNLNEQVKLYEFVVLRGARKIDQYGTPDATYPLRAGFFARLFGQQSVVYFYKLTPDLLDEAAVHLTPEEEEEVRASIPEGDEENFHDYTLGVGNRLDVIGSAQLDELLGVLHRTRAHTQGEFQHAVDLLADVRIALYDQVELAISAGDEDLLDHAVHNIYDFFVPPSEKSEGKRKKKKGKGKPKADQPVQLPETGEQQAATDALPQAGQLPWTPEGEAAIRNTPEPGDLEQTMIFSPQQQRALQQAMQDEEDWQDEEDQHDVQVEPDGGDAGRAAEPADIDTADADAGTQSEETDDHADEDQEESAAENAGEFEQTRQIEPAEQAVQTGQEEARQEADQPPLSKREAKRARRKARRAEKAMQAQEEAAQQAMGADALDMEQTQSLPPVPASAKPIEAHAQPHWNGDGPYDEEDDQWDSEEDEDEDEEEIPAWLVKAPIERKPGSTARRSVVVEEQKPSGGGIKRFFGALLHFIGIEETVEEVPEDEHDDQWLEEELQQQLDVKKKMPAQPRVYERRHSTPQDVGGVAPQDGPRPVIRVVPRDRQEDQPTRQIEGITKQPDWDE